MFKFFVEDSAADQKAQLLGFKDINIAAKVSQLFERQTLTKD